MSNSRLVEEREDGLRSMRKFSETFLPYIMLIGAAMTWYANSASVSLVDTKFQESLKYTDKAVEAIRVEASSRLEAVRIEAIKNNESDKEYLKSYSDSNRSGMRAEFSAAISEVKSQQAAMDSKLDFLVEAADGPRRVRRR